MNVTHSTVGGLIHSLAIGLHPVQIAQLILRAGRLDRQLPGSLSRRLVIHFDLDLLADRLLEIVVGIGRISHLVSVHRDQVLSLGDHHARLGQRSSSVVLPVLAFVYFLESVEAAGLVRLEVGPQKPDVYRLASRHLSSSHVGVRGGQFSYQLPQQVG